MENEIRVPINSDADIVPARQQGRMMAKELGFSTSDQALIATAISEVARNIVQYAYRGEIILAIIRENGKQGILVIAQDEGPGIVDIGLALQDGYSTTRSLGLGLPGAKRLSDDFQVVSEVGRGTTVTMKKWIHPHGK
jgi:serine/threonine-protein kinase RsbT